MEEKLKALGNKHTQYQFACPNSVLLEKFNSPFSNTTKNRNNVSGEIAITCPEFTSICPITGQPDFATIEIKYMPRNYCLESKSLKLYLNSFRNHGEFHEDCVNRIANDLIDLLTPWQLTVIGDFAPRGGIPFCPVARYVRPSSSGE